MAVSSSFMAGVQWMNGSAGQRGCAGRGIYIELLHSLWEAGTVYGVIKSNRIRWPTGSDGHPDLNDYLKLSKPKIKMQYLIQ